MSKENNICRKNKINGWLSYLTRYWNYNDNGYSYTVQRHTSLRMYSGMRKSSVITN